MLFAAIVGALAMVPQRTEANDRGFGSFGSRHFSGHAGPQLQLRHHGLDLHQGGFFGKPQPFETRPFGHFDRRSFGLKFGMFHASSRDISAALDRAASC
jgi:hypothetical protein